MISSKTPGLTPVQLIKYQRLLSTSIAIALSLLFDFENVISGSFPPPDHLPRLIHRRNSFNFLFIFASISSLFPFPNSFFILFFFFSKFIFSYISLGLCEPPALTPVAMMVLGTDIFLDLTYCTFRLLCLGYAAFQTTSMTYGSSPGLYIFLIPQPFTLRIMAYPTFSTTHPALRLLSSSPAFSF